MPNLPLPDFVLDPEKAHGRLFLEHGLRTFRAAACHVHALSYGRTSRPHAYELVLGEGRGTCSSKHALLAALATEHHAEVQLMLGLFEMSEANTPGVGPTLERYGLETIPEAHCYLRCQNRRIDLTHPGSSGECTLRFLREIRVSPGQVATVKHSWHREQMESWCRERALDASIVWRVREACIEALASRTEG